MSKLISTYAVEVTIGSGVKDDPFRIIYEIYKKEGEIFTLLGVINKHELKTKITKK